MVGELRHRIQFWKTVKGSHPDTNQQIDTWVQHVEVWGKYDFRQAGSDEAEKAGRDGFERKVVFTLRYRNDIENEMYIKLSDRDDEFKIVSILPDLNRCYLDIETIQVDPAKKQIISTSEGDEWQDGSGDGWEFNT